MPRLIEVRTRPGLPLQLTVQVGDILLITATGGRVRGGSAVGLIGSYARGALAAGGRVLAPIGAPSKVLFQAEHPGKAEIEVVMGDPWRATSIWTLEVLVEASRGPYAAPTFDAERNKRVLLAYTGSTWRSWAGGGGVQTGQPQPALVRHGVMGRSRCSPPWRWPPGGRAGRIVLLAADAGTARLRARLTWMVGDQSGVVRPWGNDSGRSWCLMGCERLSSR